MDKITNINKNAGIERLIKATEESLDLMTPVKLKGILNRLPDNLVDALVIALRNRDKENTDKRLGNYLMMAVYQVVQSDEKREILNEHTTG